MNLIGKGLTAEVYQLDENADKVIKLFKKDYPLNAIQREFNNAQLINSYKIAAPVAYEIKQLKLETGNPAVANLENRTGIVYTYVKGQSIDKLFDAQINLEQNLMAFCNLQKNFFAHQEPSLLSYKQYGMELVNWRNPDEKTAGEYINFINQFPESNTVIHGDYHPLNVLVDADGTLKVIDFMNIMRAPAKYDIARTYYLIGTLSKEFAKIYLSAMGYKPADISEYIKLAELYRKMEG